MSTKTKTTISMKKFSGINAVIAAGILGAIGLYAVFGAGATGKPATATNHYDTLISSTSDGYISACKTSTKIELAIRTTTGIAYSRWFDSNPPSNAKLKPNTTSYKSVNISGTNFFAAVYNAGMGGYSPASLPVSSINNCSTPPTSYLETFDRLSYSNGAYRTETDAVVRGFNTSPNSSVRMTNEFALKDLIASNQGKYVQTCINFKVPVGSTWITLYNLPANGSNAAQQYFDTTPDYSTFCTPKAAIMPASSGFSFPDVRSSSADLYVKDIMVQIVL